MIIILACVLAGCVSTVDVRSHLEGQVQPKAGLQQTQFAYIGTVATPGGRVHVATQRLVLTGMLAPRGQAWLHLFDRQHNLLKSLTMRDRATPLWCEGSKIYLFGFGAFPDVTPAPELAALFDDPGLVTGNVLDLSAGVDRIVLRREKQYGSSGGIDDDPVKIEKNTNK
jgi:hypothetical protein